MIPAQRSLTIHNVVGVVLIILGALLLPLAIGAWLGGNYAHNYVSSELKNQKISFAQDMSMEPAALQRFSGQTVDTGEEAKAYATMIAGHVAKITGGKTFAEVSAAALQNPNDQALQQQKRVALEGNTVYGALQNAYGWWLIGSITKWAAAGLGVIGVMFVLVGRRQARKWPTLAR